MYICSSEHMNKCLCGWIRKFLKLVLKTNTYQHLTVTLLHTHMKIYSDIPAIDGSTSGSSLFVCLWDLLSLSADFLLQTKSYTLSVNLESPKEQEVTPMRYGQYCGWLMVGIWPKITIQLHVLCNCWYNHITLTSTNCSSFSFLVAKAWPVHKKHSWFGI